MKAVIILVIAILVLAAVPLLVSGCTKRSDTQTEEDGGVRHYVDTNAPKTIQSTQIIAFSCEFSATHLELDSSPVAGRYYTLDASQERGSYEARSDGDVYGRGEFAPDAAFFEALQQIVTQYDFARHNGQYYTVSGLPPDLGAKLEIRYASGESIAASNNQSCFLSLEAMEALVALFENHK